jgi:hypothetical protein
MKKSIFGLVLILATAGAVFAQVSSSGTQSQVYSQGQSGVQTPEPAAKTVVPATVTPAQAPVLPPVVEVEKVQFSDIKVFALELGAGSLYDVGLKTIGPTQTVSTVFGLSDTLQAAFTIITGDNTTTHSYRLIRLTVFPVLNLGVQLYFGSDGTPVLVSGFGLSFTVFRKTSDSLTTALHLTTQYLASNNLTGVLGMGLNLHIGY